MRGAIVTFCVLLFYLAHSAGTEATYHGPRNYVQVTYHEDGTTTLNTLYGQFYLDNSRDALLNEILRHPTFDRLKSVFQYGPWYYTVAPIAYNRFDHSIGVFAIVRRNGGSHLEQVAALLHDVSHTVFSHTGGYVFAEGDLEADAFQDDHHEAFMRQSGLDSILTRYGLTIDDIHHKNGDFLLLEQPRPDINADRFEYILSGALWEDMITKKEAQNIVDNVAYDTASSTWYFMSIEPAYQFATCALNMTEHTWGSPHNCYINRLIGSALRHMLDEGNISLYDIYFGSDVAMWNHMKHHPNGYIQSCLKQAESATDALQINATAYDTIVYPKFRGVDPYVLHEGSYVRLTHLDEEFRSRYNQIKHTLKAGIPVAYESGCGVNNTSEENVRAETA